MRLSAAQLAAEPGDIERNVRMHVAAVEAAVSQRSDLVLFPELSLTGYEPKLARELATHSDDRCLDVFQALAVDHDIVICVGLPIRRANGVRIGMVVFQPKAARLIYEKQRLHPDEAPYFIPGVKPLTLRATRHALAPAICYESLRWDHADAAAGNGADVYLASVAKSRRNTDRACEHYAAVARKHSMIVLMANATGPADDFVCAGRSRVAVASNTAKTDLRSDGNSTLRRFVGVRLMLKRFLLFLAACAGILLLTLAVVMPLFEILSIQSNGVSDGTRWRLIGVAGFAFVTLLPGVVLYRWVANASRRGARAAMHAALFACLALFVGFLGWGYSSGALDRSKVALSDGVLLIQGRLDRDLLRSFKQIMAAEPAEVRRVRLRSLGGDTYVGMAIGREIHRRRLDVEVDKRCYSSCANYMFTAGRAKYLESADLVRFHGGALQPNFVDNARELLRDGKQMFTGPDLSDLDQLRQLYGLRDDFPFNSASFILAEQAFFAEIGASQLVPVLGQYGEYAPWFDDGAHDFFYYSPEDYAVLGVMNIHLGDVSAAASGEIFRAQASATSVAAVQAGLAPLFAELAAALPFHEDGIWR